MYTVKSAPAAAIGQALITLMLLAPAASHAQFLQGLVDRAVNAAQRAAQDGLARPTRKPAAEPESAPGTAVAGTASGAADKGNAFTQATAGPAEMPGQGKLSPRLGLTTQLANGVRTQDFRKQVPEAFDGRNLPEGLTELANPYLPDDRRVFKVWALAPHPDGGIVFWADARHFSSPDDDDEFQGLWRMEADGRVTPFAVESEAEFQKANLPCDGPFNQVGVGRQISLVVEPNGNVLGAGSRGGAVFRFHRNGFVERIAGAGENFCSDSRGNGVEYGYRDGAGRQALFSNQLVIARANDGGIFVAEQESSQRHALARIRHIDPKGVVSTVYTGENCAGRTCPIKTMLGLDAMLVDRDGQLLVADQGVQAHNAAGQLQGYARAHRFDSSTGKASLMGYSVDLIPATGVPFGQFKGLAQLADGRFISSAQGGFIVLDGAKPAFNYWVKWTNGRDDDGPVATTSGLALKKFCVAADGSIFTITDKGLRRMDLKTQRVSTWLR